MAFLCLLCGYCDKHSNMFVSSHAKHNSVFSRTVMVTMSSHAVHSGLFANLRAKQAQAGVLWVGRQRDSSCQAERRGDLGFGYLTAFHCPALPFVICLLLPFAALMCLLLLVAAWCCIARAAFCCLMCSQCCLSTCAFCCLSLKCAALWHVLVAAFA